jgi:hypothetical protein
MGEGEHIMAGSINDISGGPGRCMRPAVGVVDESPVPGRLGTALVVPIEKLIWPGLAVPSAFFFPLPSQFNRIL